MAAARRGRLTGAVWALWVDRHATMPAPAANRLDAGGVTEPARAPPTPESGKVLPMPIDWSDNITIAELADEPERSEEFAAIWGRLNDGEAPGPIPHLVLNFSGVTYLNSSHLAQLLRMRKRLGELNRQLVLCSL